MQALLSVCALLALACAAAAQCSGTVTDAQHTLPILDPASIPRWQNKVANPLHPSYVFPPDRVTMGAGIDYYRIGMRQIKSQILPAGCPNTDVFAYGLAGDPMNNPASYAFPGHTFVAFKNRPIKVSYVHTQMPAQHLFPIDRTFHCGSAKNCSPDVRTVVHLHGGYAPDHSDGFPEAWGANDGSVGIMYNPLYTYPNNQDAMDLWYHDHAWGITRLNVYAGLAGFYILRQPRESTLQSLNLLPRYPFDIPIVIQDRSFFPNGSLAYPDAPFTAPTRLMNTNFGTVLVVNGKAWPKSLHEPRKYRLRFLNGCNSRFLNMSFVSTSTSNPTTLPVWWIAADHGFLNAPVDMTGKAIQLGPAERADIIVDFSAAQPEERFILTNNAAAPFPYGTKPQPGDPLSEVIQFRVSKPLTTAIPDALPPPAKLRTNPKVVPSNLSGVKVRQLMLFDAFDTKYVRIKREVGTPSTGGKMFVEPITENIALGATEIWEIYNPTGETHPMHIHQVAFLAIDRHDIKYITTNPLNVTLGPTSYPVAPEEYGEKDTIRVAPSTVVRLYMKFTLPGLYVWHCHMLEHEDYDMMRPLCVGGNCSTAWQSV